MLQLTAMLLFEKVISCKYVIFSLYCRASRNLTMLYLARFFAATGAIQTLTAEHSISLSRYKKLFVLGIMKVDSIF